MRRFVVLFVALALFGLTAVAAGASTDPRVTTLQKQVTAMTKQVAALQQSVRSMREESNAAFTEFAKDQDRQDDVDACNYATLFKLSVVEYQVISYLAGEAPDPTVVPFSDDGACARLGRDPVTSFALTRSPFSALEQLLAR